jgi:hypothetical protein
MHQSGNLLRVEPVHDRPLRQAMPH